MSALQRQNKTDRISKTTLEYAPKPFPFLRLIESAFQRININRKLPLLQSVRERIFIGADEIIRIDGQRPGEFLRESFSVRGTEAVIAIGIGDQIRVAPERDSVRTPITTECPTR